MLKSHLHNVDANIYWDLYIAEVDRRATATGNAKIIQDIAQIKEYLRKAFVSGFNNGASLILNQLPEEFEPVVNATLDVRFKPDESESSPRSGEGSSES